MTIITFIAFTLLVAVISIMPPGKQMKQVQTVIFWRTQPNGRGHRFLLLPTFPQNKLLDLTGNLFRKEFW